MALDTYTNLKATLQTWLARADLAADVDDCIDMFEAWVNRNLRVQQMEVEATTPAAEYLPLPTDFIELRDIQWMGLPRVQLEYMTPAMSDIADPYGVADIPGFYTVVGQQIRLIPAPLDSTLVRIAYYQKIPALTGSNASNWLLALYPDAYLYGPLIHGNVRIKDTQMASAVQSGWSSIMAEMDLAGRKANFGSLLRVRTA